MSHKKAKKKNTAKKQKEKVVYYDDNSTIFDMSGVRDSRRRSSSAGASDGSRGGQAPRNARQNNNPYGEKKSATFKEKWKTYVAAVKMMFPWMCIALIAIGVLYFVVVFFGRCSA